MRELYTKALVLSRNDANEVDGRISLFTEQYGKIIAYAKSVRKNTSKLSAHLQPLSFIRVRLIQKAGPRDGFGIIDAIYDDHELLASSRKRYDLIPLVILLDSVAYELQQDKPLWAFVVEVFKKSYPPRKVTRGALTLLGFLAQETRCGICKERIPAIFVPREHGFLCDSCASNFSLGSILYI